MITAEILLDSINPSGRRVTTWVLTYPRFIHSEFMTHRCFSRNAASSRAIPVEKMLTAISENPAMPEQWGANQKGMQAEQVLGPQETEMARQVWLRAKNKAVEAAYALLGAGLHKQLANRVTEPWAHMTVIATATAHANFFKLRAHPAAQPEFQVLAYRMLDKYLDSTPVNVAMGMWHIPFIHESTEGNLPHPAKLKISTARCARISYLNFDKRLDHEKDYELHDKLAESGHWSPFEHCCMAVPDYNGVAGNFQGWHQYRKYFPNENVTDVCLQEIFDKKPEWISTL